MKYNNKIIIKGREIAIDMPTYFIADIAANHDGDIERTKQLIWLAKESGADAVKFQHFLAEKIVSDFGFKSLGSNIGHQSSWGNSVYDIYKKYECDRSWTETLIETAKKADIDFLTTPYDFEAVELLDKHLPAYKIGAGDITWIDFIELIAKKNKPVFLSTGASDISDVERAVDAIVKYNRDIVLMQCNTNYTGSLENFKYINLNVLTLYALRYPNMILGLSDHTPFHASVLGAIALGARVIEKHFTDDTTRMGPDHLFSMDPATWRAMIERSRELELALGGGIKRIEGNETETAVVQRRSIRLTRDKQAGERLELNDLEALRPAPKGSLPPYRMVDIVGKVLAVSKVAGESLYESEVR